MLSDEWEGRLATFLDRLREEQMVALATSVNGEIEAIAPGEIRGWAVDFNDPDRRLFLELYVADAFVLAASPSEYREDIRSRYGGAGWNGFRLRYDFRVTGVRAMRACIKEAVTGASIASFELPPSKPPIEEAFAIRAEIAEVRSALTRIESRLPTFSYGLTLPLTAYDDYYNYYYGTSAPEQPIMPHSNSVVIIDAMRTSGSLDRLLLSLHRQLCRPNAVLLLHPPGLAALENASTLAGWQSRSTFNIHVLTVQTTTGLLEAMQTSATSVGTDPVILCRPDAWFHPEAVMAFDRAIASGAILAYGDSDTVFSDDFGRERHLNPVFRTSFDYDLLLQQDYLDTPIAIRADLLTSTGLTADDAAHLPLALALRLQEQQAEGLIVHIAHVLSHAAPRGNALPEDLKERKAIVASHLARSGVSARIESHADPLGASLPNHLRLHRQPQGGVRVAILIPTRDRLDLLEPCLASIFRSKPHNRASIEIVVIDNQSSEPDTERYLQHLVAEKQVRVMVHDGPFNWALMNNRAAAETNADMLVFLNNDTAVLTDNCWDELASHAMRPEVGAVGVRLLYENGTIQHAGAVLDGWSSFSSHEGVGSPGTDPGYMGRHVLLRRVSTVTGACLATRASLFRDLGAFDASHLPVEANDTDFCLRLAREGYSILYDPYAVFYHFESRSRGDNRGDCSRLLADAASRTMRTRWPDRVGKDPFYNSHFDPLSPPCTRLRPPLKKI